MITCTICGQPITSTNPRLRTCGARYCVDEHTRRTRLACAKRRQMEHYDEHRDVSRREYRERQGYCDIEILCLDYLAACRRARKEPSLSAERDVMLALHDLRERLEE